MALIYGFVIYDGNKPKHVLTSCNKTFFPQQAFFARSLSCSSKKRFSSLSDQQKVAFDQT